jgi:non-canonical purine NTP pyrophosphatase (RdgB/HAM1 family)
MSHDLYYVTSNPGKFAEVSHYFHILGSEVPLKQFSADIPEIQTLDQMAIAIDKAKKAFEILKKPLLIDDAAMYFEKYYKFPGTLTRYVAQGLGFEGLKRLIDDGDRAYFLLYVVYIESPDQLHIFEGACSGRLIKPDVFEGDPHLPFDVFFIPDGADITYSQMRDSFDKHADFYYRIRAMKKFLTWYKQR